MTALALDPARLWQRHPREIIALGGLAFAAAIAVAGAAWSTPADNEISRAQLESTPPAPPPMLLRAIAPDQAIAVNDKTPIAGGPNPPALPFDAGKLSKEDRARALECLTSAAYYEAGDQGDDGERAVAQVVLNRVRHPAFPASVCGVVYQGSTRANGCQFTFTCDGSLERRPDAEGWARASRIAAAALNGAVYAPVGWATHYHADYVVPYWAATMAKDAVVGAHIFYRWPGSWGQPAAFTEAYARQEPNPAALRSAALAAFASRPAPATADEVADLPGAEVEKAPAGRVAVRFKVAAAQKAIEKTPHEEYVKQFAASDNLRWALSGDTPPSEAPLGRTASGAKQAAPANSAPAAQ